MKQLSNFEGNHCANCGTPLQGSYCHVCGQSMHSVLKPVHGLLEDTLDIVFNVDGRVVHTLPPLFTRPGFLTLEYFAGRRTRYLTPFRLMFSLCLLTFFVCQLAFNNVNLNIDGGHNDDTGAYAELQTPAAVKQQLQHDLAELNQAAQIPDMPAAAREAIATGKQEVLQRQAKMRLAELGVTASLPTPAIEDASKLAKPPDPDKWLNWLNRPSHINVGWLPGFATSSLDRSIDHFKANVLAFTQSRGNSRREVTQRWVAGTLALLPQTMFVLIPLFAMLLKLLYLFRRRLYMEHLIVALHSHALLFLILLLGVLLEMLSRTITPHAAWIGQPIGWLQTALWFWAPIYLLLMQKRVYQQGWPMTVLKYLFTGWCYLWLLMTALGFALLLAMAN